MGVYDFQTLMDQEVSVKRLTRHVVRGGRQTERVERREGQKEGKRKVKNGRRKNKENQKYKN